MIRNYITTAIRNLKRQRFFSIINIFGLAISMSVCLAIIMLIADQLTYDQHNSKRSRIYRITSNIVSADGLERGGNAMATSPMPLKNELIDKYAGVEKAARLKRGFANNWIEFEQDVNVPISGYFADPEVLDVFEYELEYGNPQTALTEPYSVVLTKTAAKKLFKDDNPLGLTLKVGDKGTYVVTGVLKETNNKSHIVFDGLASMATVRSLEADGKLNKDLDNWYNYWNGWTYIVLQEGTSPNDIIPYFKQVYQERMATLTNPDKTRAVFSLQPMRDITPGPFMNNPIGPFLPWIFIYFLGGLAGLVMLTSCFNFTNLSIARSLTRAREIGVRKVSGAARWQIFIQFLSESIITSLLSLVLALAFLVLVKPLLLNITFARVFRWDLESNLYVYGVFVVFAVLVGILAGFFPAVVLSGLQPLSVLKNFGNMKLFSRMGLRRTLLVAQFTLSLIFILSVIVAYNQLNLFLRADHGFSMKNTYVVRLNNTDALPLKTELLKQSNINEVSIASHVPASGTTYGTGFKKSLDEKEWVNLNYYSVDENYLSSLEVGLKAGRFFSPAAGASNQNFIVINEQAVRQLHYTSNEEALGQVIIIDRDSAKMEIIGVVQDYNHQMLMQKLDGMALLYSPKEFHILQVKYTGDKKQAAQTIEKTWAVVNPSMKVDYKDMEEEILSFYQTIFGDAVNIVTFVAILAVIISCLGLLGMATYTTETRIKEVSIRKILGSSNASLVLLLSKSFIFLLLTSVAIAVPCAYFINSLWLDLMAYHTAFDLQVIITGVLILLVFGGITIGSQTVRASFVNPAENLKAE